MAPERIKNDFPYVEVPRHDEQPDGIAAAQSGLQKRASGRLLPGPDGSAAVAGRVGGSRRKGRTRLSHVIEAPTLTRESQRRARILRRALAGEIAATVGGGFCGVVASLLVKFASQKTAAAEEAFEAGDFDTHRKLSESARMDLMYAREHAAKEAATRPRPEHDVLVPYMRPGDLDLDDETTPDGSKT